MFERAAQVNAIFPGGSSRRAEVVAALRGLGLGEEQITVIARAAPEQRPVAAPGWFARLTGRRGDVPDTAAASPDLHVLVHLGKDAALAESVQEVFRRFGATGVSNYSQGRVPVHTFATDRPSPDGAGAGPLAGKGSGAEEAAILEGGDRS